MKTRLLAAMAAGALCLSALAPVQAQTADWPNKPLRLLVGSAPGGGT
ncbi:ABC transporter substrate-binding protein, partial [Achromobacter xylosoxidans]